MKRTFSFLVGFCFLAFACGENPDDITPLNAEVVFQVDLSGDFTSNFVQDSVSAFLHSNQIIIKGFDTDENIVTVTIDPSQFASGTQTVGTHEIAQSNSPAKVVVNVVDGSSLFIAESGSVIVTEYSNKIIKGTFSFEATKYGDTNSTISGTNGKFTAVVGEL